LLLHGDVCVCEEEEKSFIFVSDFNNFGTVRFGEQVDKALFVYGTSLRFKRRDSCYSRDLRTLSPPKKTRSIFGKSGVFVNYAFLAEFST